MFILLSKSSLKTAQQQTIKKNELIEGVHGSIEIHLTHHPAITALEISQAINRQVSRERNWNAHFHGSLYILPELLLKRNIQHTTISKALQQILPRPQEQIMIDFGGMPLTFVEVQKRFNDSHPLWHIFYREQEQLQTYLF